MRDLEPPVKGAALTIIWHPRTKYSTPVLVIESLAGEEDKIKNVIGLKKEIGLTNLI